MECQYHDAVEARADAAVEERFRVRGELLCVRDERGFGLPT